MYIVYCVYTLYVYFRCATMTRPKYLTISNGKYIWFYKFVKLSFIGGKFETRMKNDENYLKRLLYVDSEIKCRFKRGVFVILATKIGVFVIFLYPHLTDKSPL